MFQKFFENNYTISEVRQMNPLTLAFIGDAVYEIMVREYLTNKNLKLSAHKLHVKTIGYVKAKSQSESVRKIFDKLNEEEIAIFKRGRNTKSATVPKNADIQDYRAATGFEALIGYLYLSNQGQRLKELADYIFDINTDRGDKEDEKR